MSQVKEISVQTDFDEEEKIPDPKNKDSELPETSNSETKKTDLTEKAESNTQINKELSSDMKMLALDASSCQKSIDRPPQVRTEYQNQERQIIPFSSEDNMIWLSWLNYFNTICISDSRDDLWKIQHIQKYLKGKALTLYINNCLNVLHWEELVDLFNEEFNDPRQLTLTDFTELKFKLGEDINEYYQKKLKLGRSLGLSAHFILDGLTEGLPLQIKSLVVTNCPKTTNAWRELVYKLVKLQSNTPQESQRANVTQSPPVYRQWQPQRSNEYALNPQARPFNYRVPFQPPRGYVPNSDRSRNYRPQFNQPRAPGAHYQGRLPPAPCRICSSYNIPNAFHWERMCPFKNPNMNPVNVQDTRDVTSPITNTNYQEDANSATNQSVESSGMDNSGKF